MKKSFLVILAIMAMFMFAITPAMTAPIVQTVDVSVTVPPATTVSIIPPIVITAIPGAAASETSAFTITSTIGGAITASATAEVTGITGDPALSVLIDGAASPGTFADTGLTSHTLTATITVPAGQAADTYTGGIITVTVTPTI